MKMKTYNDYYKFALNEWNKWYRGENTEWWKDTKEYKYFDKSSIDGEYIETTNILSLENRNNSPIIENHTNIPNKEWNILFDMLGQALIDWCIENNTTNYWYYRIKVERYIDECGYELFKLGHNIKILNHDDSCWMDTFCTKFDSCDNFLCDIIIEFISRHSKDIPLDWNTFYFGLDALDTSCEYGKWVCDSDGSMSLLNISNNERTAFVKCM